jgi:DmsE family decaheme c-type cytochrome
MSKRSSGFPPGLLMAVFVFGCSAAMSLHAAAAGGRPSAPAATPAAKAAKQAAPAAAATQAGEYVGQETCLTCHEDRDYKGTLHAMTSNARTPASTHGCESCHGPGKAHVDGGGDKTKIINPANLKPQQSSEICATCHNRDSHLLWSGSQHDQRNVGCVTCHSIHAPKGERQLKAKSELELCATCHRNVVNKQNRNSHMPVREGKLECTSCHNVHGSVNAKLLKVGTTINESCTSCHAEKRGPMLWEHPPVVESCTTCHDPHGSNNDRLLVARAPFLCQRCHVSSRHPPTIYEGFTERTSGNANKIFGRSCMVCHSQIHGSNAPAGKAFLR